ncbi:MAG: chorismate mutase [Chloroflexi bacterium]|nr:MAG: chorismate mutase [Chloroflexota bacterium]
MKFRGVRGATTADANTPEAILQATRELLQQMIDVNGIQEEDVASILFSTTPDLNAVYPAKAARELGWTQVALMGFQEIDVPGGLDRCIRILIHWNTTRRQDEIHHVFSKGATCLRPDLAQKLTNSL